MRPAASEPAGALQRQVGVRHGLGELVLACLDDIDGALVQTLHGGAALQDRPFGGGRHGPRVDKLSYPTC